MTAPPPAPDLTAAAAASAVAAAMRAAGYPQYRLTPLSDAARAEFCHALRIRPAVWDSPATVAAIRTPAGLAKMLHLMLLPNHPDATPELAAEIAGRVVSTLAARIPPRKGAKAK